MSNTVIENVSLPTRGGVLVVRAVSMPEICGVLSQSTFGKIILAKELKGSILYSGSVPLNWMV